jgi:hypothetical protein
MLLLFFVLLSVCVAPHLQVYHLFVVVKKDGVTTPLTNTGVMGLVWCLQHDIPVYTERLFKESQGLAVQAAVTALSPVINWMAPNALGVCAWKKSPDGFWLEEDMADGMTEIQQMKAKVHNTLHMGYKGAFEAVKSACKTKKDKASARLVSGWLALYQSDSLPIRLGFQPFCAFTAQSLH